MVLDCIYTEGGIRFRTRDSQCKEHQIINCSPVYMT